MKSQIKDIREMKPQSPDGETPFGKAPALDITVREQVIGESVARNSGHCMVAEAIREHFPKAKFIAVDIQTIRFSDMEKKERYTYLTPRGAQHAIIKFDQGIKPEPFEFRLRGAQITRACRLTFLAKRRAQAAAAAQRAEKCISSKRARPQKAIMRGNNRLPGSAAPVPDKLGGSTPPVSAHRDPPVAGQVRRAFGLRALNL